MKAKNENTSNNLSIKQNDFIAAFIAEKGNVARACVVAQIDEKTFYRWRKEPEFFDALIDARTVASQLIKDMVLRGFTLVFQKATAEILAYNTEENAPQKEKGSKEKPKRKPLPILRGSEYVSMGKELIAIAEKIAPEEKVVSQDANNFLEAVHNITQLPMPLHESVGDFDPNSADSEEEEEEAEAEEEEEEEADE